ncbi:hypothetical protein TRAPUB_11061 [Trametes pubescens]|uniref:Uncharacterized protein n=1 Tax=Trametes pubescens TaxID=154538 RepID=A0A1M2VXZ3_TRAPU|nr:hypothetical protein TRAPUB_11061 [Trametes pubescens]
MASAIDVAPLTTSTPMEQQGRTVTYLRDTVTGSSFDRVMYALAAPDIITDEADDADAPPPLERADGPAARAETVTNTATALGSVSPIVLDRVPADHTAIVVAPAPPPLVSVRSALPVSSTPSQVNSEAIAPSQGNPVIVTANAAPYGPAFTGIPIPFGQPQPPVYAVAARPEHGSQLAVQPLASAAALHTNAQLLAPAPSTGNVPTGLMPTVGSGPQAAVASDASGVSVGPVQNANVTPAPAASTATAATTTTVTPATNTALTAHPNVNDVERVPNEVVERMRAIANYVHPPTNTFAVSLVPVNSEWGRGKDERFLVYSGKPVVIWLVGRSKKLWFYKPNGEAQTRVSIGLDLSVAGDLDAVKALYTRARPRGALTSDVVYASRLQTVRERGATSSQAVPFEEVYDATEQFTAKSVMPRLRAADIAEEDLVVVECNLTRWKKQAEMKKKMWTAWDVGFELISIAVLYAEPTNTPDDVPAGENEMFSL